MTVNVDVSVIGQDVDVAVTRNAVSIAGVGSTIEVLAGNTIVDVLELGPTDVEIDSASTLVEIGPVGTEVEISAVGIQGPPGNDGAPGQIVSDKLIYQTKALTPAEAAAEAFTITPTPSAGVTPLVQLPSGSIQFPGTDYVVIGSIISYSGLGMASLGLVAGDRIVIQFVID